MEHADYTPQPLKLGKGVAFVKGRLRRLPQGDDVWEGDFMTSPNPLDPRATVWVGLIVHQDGWVVTECMIDHSPTVNDLAALLARAMRRPYDQEPRRPQTIRLRAKPEWQELHPHLAQLGIEVIAAPRLAQWDKVSRQCRREAIESRAKSKPRGLDAKYPNIAAFVEQWGWIEIGDQGGAGFVVRALDEGGVVFETQKPKTLHAAMAGLEKGIGKFIREQG